MPVIKHVVKDEVLIISIDEVRLVDGAALDQCSREIIAVLDKTSESCAVLHFGRVSFMSSAALGMLIRIHKKCKEYKISLKLCNIAPEIRQVFKITGLEKVFDIQNDMAGVMEAFKKGGQLSFRKKGPTSYEVGEGR